MTEKLKNPFKINELIETVNNLVDTTVDDSNLVHKTGNETVAGTKTFSSTISGSINGNAATVTNGVYTNNNQTITGTKTFARAVDQSAATWTPMIPIKDTNTDFTVNPSYNKDYYLIQMNDKNGKLNSWVTSQYLTSGESSTYINVRARNTANTGNVDGSIGIIAKRDGTIVTKSHTPPTSDNSTQIATTAFVKAQGYAIDSNIVHKTGDETITGIKTFNSEIDIGAGEYKKSIYRQSNGSFAISMNKQDNSGWMSYIQMSTAGRVVINAGDATATDRTIALQGNSATAPTPITSDNSTKIATTAYVKAQGYAVDSGLVHTTGNESISGTKTFSAATYGTASDAVNSIVTTIGIKKTQDCYVKLGNGLILQWGTFGSSNNQKHTITLPTPFSNTDYVVVATQQRTETNNFDANWHVLSKATTSFSIKGQSSSMNWLAIGY